MTPAPDDTEVRRLRERVAELEAELAVWRDEDAREAKYKWVSEQATAAEAALAAERAALNEAVADIAVLEDDKSLLRNQRDAAELANTELRRLWAEDIARLTLAHAELTAQLEEADSLCSDLSQQ